MFWSRLRNYLYDRSILKSVRAPCFVISVGNLTWGGTGKTSLVETLSRFLISQGRRLAIVSRGYLRASTGPKLISDGSSLKCSWKESGDEAYLLATTVPQAIVAVAQERSDAFPILASFSPGVIVLDDAFQHRQIARDLDLVLIDASEDITAQKVIPFGKLREETRSLKRADAVVLTHSNQMHAATKEWISRNVQCPVFHANYLPNFDVPLAGKKVAAFCAIGSPQHFYRLLFEQGAELVAAKSFRDHHVFTREEIEEFRMEATQKGAEFMLTTAKDAVRIDPECFDPSLKVIRVKLQIAEEALFFEFLNKAMHREKA
ncbi:tetraacyldisaccharide 4'-kinase [bacterium]|nr:tetraacyldisaccharide 4'-kinase [bacterium]MCI0601689.1 tetraacyldisaccharide 4'-kinase [bacterium]